KYTPVSRACLRIAVIWPTVVPMYSAAIRECALAATSATSATTFCFWDRLIAICHSSCELRLRLQPLTVLGDAAPWHRGWIASRWWPSRGVLKQNIPEGHHHLRWPAPCPGAD